MRMRCHCGRYKKRSIVTLRGSACTREKNGAVVNVMGGITVGYTIIGEVGAGMAYVRGGHAPHHVPARLLLQYH
jgi:hypothetical protein